MSVQPIAVINMSSKVSDAQVNTMVQALNTMLPQFCTSWSVRATSCTAFSKNQNPNILYKIYISDIPDVAGVFGYHDDTNAVPYGKVFVNPILQSKGGGILTGTLPNAATVSQVLAHEVFELLIDANANTWWLNPTSTGFYAAEVCDPVQGNVVKVTVNNQQVWLTDYILPKWTDVQYKTGPYNYLNTLRAPLTADKGGYIIYIMGTAVSYILGSSLSDYTIQEVITDSRLSLDTRRAAAIELGVPEPTE